MRMVAFNRDIGKIFESLGKTAYLSRRGYSYSFILGGAV